MTITNDHHKTLFLWSLDRIIEIIFWFYPLRSRFHFELSKEKPTQPRIICYCLDLSFYRFYKNLIEKNGKKKDQEKYIRENSNK